MISTDELQDMAEGRRVFSHGDGLTLAAELIAARAKIAAAEALAEAAGRYATGYVQDEAAEPELCVPGQHDAAIALFAALARWEAHK